MSFTLVVGGERKLIGLGGSRTLAEILNEAEYTLLQGGELIAVTEGGGLMDLSSPLEDGQVVTLRPAEPEDAARFGFCTEIGCPPPKKYVVVTLDADDALLLQGHLRSDRRVFVEARNEVMTGMLDRVEEALSRAGSQAKLRGGS